MDEKLYDFLLSLPKANIINAMWGALGHMSYYSRSRSECIVLALGGTVDEQPSGRMRFTLPDADFARKLTAHCPL